MKNIRNDNRLRSSEPASLLVKISQVVEAQALPVGDVKSDPGAWVTPAGPQAAKLLGLDGERLLTCFWRPKRDGRVLLAIVVYIHPGKDVRRVKVKRRPC